MQQRRERVHKIGGGGRDGVSMLAIETMLEESHGFGKTIYAMFLKIILLFSDAQAIIREESFFCISTAISC